MIDSNRRKFLVNSSAASLGLGLRRLAFTVPGVSALGAMSGEAMAAPAYTGWKDVFRKKWSWDKIVHSTHACNCFNNCSWKVYVRNGIVWREEQTSAYRQSVRGLPDFNPQGCQKGATYSNEMYSPTRVKYPLKRVGERGSGKWKRVSWDEAITDIATKMIEAVRDNGHDTIITPGATHASYLDKGGTAKFRFTDLIGGTIIEGVGDVGDIFPGCWMTTGEVHTLGSSDTRFLAKTIILWCCNYNITKIPDAHFNHEARYNGATLISISPDQSPTHMHADIWVNPKQGTDVAIALAMAHLIVKQKLYDEAHMKEQTDLPFLVREDTQKYLRESDMVKGGSEQVFYFWDQATKRAVTTPGSMGSKVRSIALGAIDPALEGHFEVTLADGKSVKVTTAFEKLKVILDKNTPEYAQEISGVGVDTIKRITHEYATRKPAMIQWGPGLGKLYHGDQLNRSIILLASLTGNIGKVGGGAWGDGVIVMEGLLGMMKVAAKTGKGRLSPMAAWQYVHGGLNDVSTKWISLPGKKTADDYIMESVQKYWMPVFPAPGKDPSILIECGSNTLRRTRMGQVLKNHLWPKLKLVVNIDMRMSTTGLQSDYVLPCAGYYETEGIKYPVVSIPYVTYKGKAVEQYADSKDEWKVFALICKKIQELAPKMGVTKYKDVLFGFDRDLSTIYDEFTEGGKWDEHVDDEVLVEHMRANTTLFKNVSLEQLRKEGQVPWDNMGPKTGFMLGGISGDFEAGKPHAMFTDYTEKKKPWNTLAGRAQYYIDHDWFIEFGEQLPVYLEAPAMGGNHPLKLTSGHTRWAIHSTWRDNDLMLRQQRGEPIIYINPKDAATRGIKDNDLVEVFNDVHPGVKLRAMVTPGMQYGVVHTYHAWEHFQHHGGIGIDAVSVSQVKPLHCVGGWGHLYFMYGGWQPNNIDKGTRVDVRKV